MAVIMTVLWSAGRSGAEMKTGCGVRWESLSGE